MKKIILASIIGLASLICIEMVFLLAILPRMQAQKAQAEKIKKENKAASLSSRPNPVATELNDVNSYLKTVSRPPIVLVPITKIKGADLQNLIKTNPRDFILLDIRDEYELNFMSFERYPFLRNIRFGNLINNQFDALNRSSQIIVASNTEGRALIAASLLDSKGYKNVKILEGGMLQWAKDKLPLQKNIPFKWIYKVLPYFDDKTIKSKLPENIEILDFGNSANGLNGTQVMSDFALGSYINSLDKNKKYIISCSTEYYCFDAVLFWNKAKDRISFSGYSGYSPKVIPQ